MLFFWVLANLLDSLPELNCQSFWFITKMRIMYILKFSTCDAISKIFYSSKILKNLILRATLTSNLPKCSTILYYKVGIYIFGTRIGCTGFNSNFQLVYESLPKLIYCFSVLCMYKMYF